MADKDDIDRMALDRFNEENKVKEAHAHLRDQLAFTAKFIVSNKNMSNDTLMIVTNQVAIMTMLDLVISMVAPKHH